MSSPLNILVIILAILVSGVMIGANSVKVTRQPASYTRLEGIRITNDGVERVSWRK